ncbi:MAG: hypothetical protein Q9208_008616 [Pyrenodesmia sp. 3 TL-2023]
MLSLLPLLTTLLLTATPLTVTSPVNTTDTDTHRSRRVSASTSGCFTGSSPPLVYFDCLKLIREQLGIGHPDTTPMTFSPDPRLAMVLIPYAKVSRTGNCNVVLGLRDQSLRSEFETWENVKNAALALARYCVIATPHMGGWMWVGQSGNLLVSVLGRETGRGVLRRMPEEEEDDVNKLAEGGELHGP